MKIYERNTRRWQSLARISFVIGLSTCSALFIFRLDDYGYVLLSALLLCSVFPVTGLAIYSDKIEIQQLYVFGFIPRTLVFRKKDTTEIVSFEMELEVPGEQDTIYPAGTARFRKFEITKLDLTRPKTERVTVYLSHEEFNLVKEAFIENDSGHWVFTPGF